MQWEGPLPCHTEMRTAGAQSNLVLLQRAGRLQAASADAAAAFPPGFSWDADDKDSATVALPQLRLFLQVMPLAVPRYFPSSS